MSQILNVPELFGSDVELEIRDNNGKAEIVFPVINPDTVDSNYLYTIKSKLFCIISKNHLSNINIQHRKKDIRTPFVARISFIINKRLYLSLFHSLPPSV